jgi:hypothetical protein
MQRKESAAEGGMENKAAVAMAVKRHGLKFAPDAIEVGPKDNAIEMLNAEFRPEPGEIVFCSYISFIVRLE